MAGQALIKQGEERRVAILGYIREYHAEQGMAPTVTEIAEAVGLSSPNATRTHLQKLAAAGFLTIVPRRARAIRLTTPAPDGWAA